MKTIARRIVKTFKRFSDLLLYNFALRVHRFTSASKELANPTPTMTELMDAITTFNNLRNSTDMAAVIVAPLKKQAKETLIGLLDQLADWVTLVARNDEAILAASGFDLNKIPSPRHILAPINVTLEDGDNLGELVADCDAVAGASGYAHQISTDPLLAEENWRGVASTIKTYTFTGLKKGTTYYVRIASIGSKNQQIWSYVVSRIAQ